MEAQLLEALTVPCLLQEGMHLPEYASEEAAGADLRARLQEPLRLEVGARALIPTGIRMALPRGYELQIRPRSGLAYRHGISVLNTPGTIDSDYRGEIHVLLINLGDQPFVIEPGMRIAQAVLSPILRGHFVPVEELPETVRGEGGFGHTGSH